MPSASETSLTNQFLIAMPQLADPNFSQTTSYICEHSPDGAMGLIINRPMDISVYDVLEQMDINTTNTGLQTVAVYYGGPVQEERGFVLHSPATQWESTIKISDEIAITTSRDILDTIAQDSGPAHFLIALGYAGWGAGQLEAELADNAWLSGPADPDIIFNAPDEQRWELAARSMGVDLNLLSSDTGHA